MNTLNLKPLDILLYRGRGLTSWVIQSMTRSRYNHVAVVVDPESYLGIESNTGHQGGVHAIDLRMLKDQAVDIYRIRAEYTVNAKKTVSFLVACLGAKYDYLGVAWLGLLKVASLLSFSLLKPYNRFQRDKDFFCSELCYEAFMGGGLDIVPQIDAAAITSPGDIAQSPVLVKVG